MTGDRLRVRVRAVIYRGEWVRSYQLVSLDGAALPAYTAGAHVDVLVPGGLVRQYSLCGDPARLNRYEIAVQRENAGRGGSVQMHRSVQAGDVLTISAPRNHFPLAEEASHHILIAGGIGVTPMMAMVHRLRSTGASFELHYGARSRSRLAFAEELQAMALGRRLHLYIDEGDLSRGMDVQRIVTAAPPASHLYACGPAGMLRAFSEACASRAAHQVHVEHFGEPAAQRPDCGGMAVADGAFRVRLARSGAELAVAPGQSILQVLRDAGLEIASSCEAGVCGTCRVHYLEGEPEHRDYVLDDADRAQDVLVCCARSKSEVLVLDL